MNEQALLDLEKIGFCVLRGVVTPRYARCAKRRIRRILASGLSDVAHSDDMWALRTHSVVRGVFERLWDTKRLISSFEGVTWKAPGERGLVLGTHVDQTFDTGERECVQGVLALTPSDRQTGCTALLPGFHKHFGRHVSRSKPPKRGWQSLSLSIPRSYKRTYPSLKEGDMLLWDSRVAHLVQPAHDKSSERMVAYVCMVPREKASPRCLKRRASAFQNGVSSTHWPHLFTARAPTGLVFPATPGCMALV
jgi:hypothetical protein